MIPSAIVHLIGVYWLHESIDFLLIFVNSTLFSIGFFNSNSVNISFYLIWRNFCGLVSPF